MGNQPMTPAEYQAFLEKKFRKKKSKYKNERVEIKGNSFMSKGEGNHFFELTLRERAGEIKDIRCQHHVSLGPANIILIVDFSYTDCKTGKLTFEEFKGFPTPEYKLKERLWEVHGPAKLIVHYPPGSGMRPKVIIPKMQGFKCTACGHFNEHNAI